MHINTRSKLAATFALLVASTSAAASEAEGQQSPGRSTLTRAEVTAEWARAQRAGEVSRGAASFKAGPPARTASMQTGPSRKQVLADVAKSLQDGTYVDGDQSYGTPVPGGGQRRAGESRRAATHAARSGAERRSE